MESRVYMYVFKPKETATAEGTTVTIQTSEKNSIIIISSYLLYYSYYYYYYNYL